VISEQEPSSTDGASGAPADVVATPPSDLPDAPRPLVRDRRLRALIQVLLLVVPWRIRRPLLARLCGWAIDPTARIGLSMVDVHDLRMAPGSHIGNFNLVGRVHRLWMGRSSMIGNFNWVRAATVIANQSVDEGPRALYMGDHSGITGQHFIDCSGGLYLGQGTMLGGCRTTVMTHQIDVATRRQHGHRTVISDRSLIASNCRVAPGTQLARESLVAMGSLARGELLEPRSLYAGNPAVRKGRYDAPPDHYYDFV
jgi:acetyltransferase-like isoleucine patch superfamily enzyme